MQRESQNLDNPHDCFTQCLACDELQDYKINFAKFHGVCSRHKDQTNRWISCKTCENNIYIYEFQLILCDYCMVNPKFLVLKCSHILCEKCIQENPQNGMNCPLCPASSENDLNIHEIIQNSSDLQNFASEAQESDYKAKPSDDKIPNNPQQNFENPNLIRNSQEIPNEIIRNSQEIPNEILSKINSIATNTSKKSRLQCQKCFIGVLEKFNEKDFQCQICNIKFCGKCFKSKSRKLWHNCIPNCIGKGIYMNQDLWNKNEFLKDHGMMIQICPCCSVLGSYLLAEGLIVTCKYPDCKTKPRFCLHCGKRLVKGEEDSHYDGGDGGLCRDVREGIDNLKKRKYIKIRLQFLDE